jgi:hypothetical protein
MGVRETVAHLPNKAFKRTKTVGCFTPFTILANNFLPLNVALGAQRMPRILLIILIVLSPIALGDESGWDVYLSDHGWATISGIHNEGEPLLASIKSVPKDIWLKHFRVFPNEDDISLQKEIHNFLETNYPRLHKEALDSAGNMHNPKVKALRTPFQEALMASSLVTKINAALKSRCERIVSASYEKFTIRKSNGKPVYSAMVWLSTDKCT